MKIDFVKTLEIWTQSNSENFTSEGVVVQFLFGIMPDGDMQKASISFERGQRTALVEVWSSGSVDFTVLDLDQGTDGESSYFRFTSLDELTDIVRNCYAQFLCDGKPQQ